MEIAIFRRGRPRRTFLSGGLGMCLLLGAGTCVAGGWEVNPEVVEGCRKDVETPPARSQTPPNAIKVKPPENGAYVGVYTASAPRDYRRFLEKTSYQPPVVFMFHDWLSDSDWASNNPHLQTFHDPLEEAPTVNPLELAEDLAKEGSVLALAWAHSCCDWHSILFWLGWRKTEVTLPRILQGNFDDYLKEVAGQVKAFGRPIMLTLFSEFNYQGSFAFGKSGTELMTEVDNICRYYGDPGWPDGPERIRDAFIHVIDLFRQEGVRNVTWFMYAGSHYMDPDHEDQSPWLHPKYFYPGDAYIDYVGQSSYFIDPTITQDVAATAPIEKSLEPGYKAWGTVTQRPLFLPEFGPAQQDSTSRAKFLRQVFNEILPGMPRIKIVTMADFDLAADCCSVPRLGEKFPDEIEALKESVKDNPYYEKTIKLHEGQ